MGPGSSDGGLERVPEWVHFGVHLEGPKWVILGVGIPESSNLGHISGLDRFGPVLYGIIHFGI